MDRIRKVKMDTRRFYKCVSKTVPINISENGQGNPMEQAEPEPEPEHVVEIDLDPEISHDSDDIVIDDVDSIEDNIHGHVEDDNYISDVGFHGNMLEDSTDIDMSSQVDIQSDDVVDDTLSFDSDNESLPSLNMQDTDSEEEQNNPYSQFPKLDLESFEGIKELAEDKSNGWRAVRNGDRENKHSIPFTRTGEKLCYVPDSRNPEDFFNALFDRSFWSVLVDNTNQYAHSKKNSQGADSIERMNHPDYKRCSRMHQWKDVTEPEMKVFFAHMIIMGIVKKPKIEKYWCRNKLSRTSFFGQVMSRDRFSNILWNLHVADDTTNPKKGSPGHDPLAKIRPFIEMCNDNFKFVYKPDVDLSMDEGCCPWKGRLSFRCYNPSKPAKFHIKLYQMSESNSGYVLGFEVYTGKGSCVNEAYPYQNPQCTVTTKNVLTLADNCDVLDKGHHMYFDNYYTSPQLMEELLHRETLSCGTVRKDRSGLPVSLKNVTLKQLPRGQCVFRRKYTDIDTPGPMFCIRWHDKRLVYMLSTMHSGVEVWTGKRNYKDNTPIYKPEVIVDYTNKMGGVDMSDQLMNYYNFLRKSIKWWRKLFIHLVNMVIMNAFILNKKYGHKKLSHVGYREYLAEYLLKDGNPQIYVQEMRIENDSVSNRLEGRHFPERIPTKEGKNKTLPLACKVCFVGKAQSKSHNIPSKRKMCTYRCNTCKLPMCITPCFQIYHEHEDYQSVLIK